MNRLTDVFGDSAVVAEDLRKKAYELEDKHNVASYPMLEAADHIESLYAEALKMQAENERLKAAQQWQPIESAPKDGTRILLFFPNDVGVISGEWNFERFNANPKPHFTHDQEQRWGVRHMRANQPTHWKPLPPPPEAKARGDQV